MNFEFIKNEVYFTAVRSRGPGGQNVNKVSSAAILYWDFLYSNFLTADEKFIAAQKLHSHINKEGQIFLRSDEFRDLEKNKARCLEKLNDLLVAAFFKPKKRRPTKPTRTSKIKRRESKSRQSDTKKTRQRVRE
jgi:ribosome-associated protein